MNEERLTPDEAKDQAEAWLRAHLGPRWRIARTRRQVKARLGLLSVSLRYSDDREDGWRCRLRDSIPRRTLKVQRGASLEDAANEVVSRARAVAALLDGRDGLAPNESKSWLAYRMWSAVKPNDL